MSNELVRLGQHDPGYKGYKDRCTGRWEVNVLGRCGDGFEISVIREDYTHGHRSFGWFNKHKRLISTSFHQFTVEDPVVFKGLRYLAQRTADRLNDNEGR